MLPTSHEVMQLLQEQALLMGPGFGGFNSSGSRGLGFPGKTARGPDAKRVSGSGQRVPVVVHARAFFLLGHPFWAEGSPGRRGKPAADRVSGLGLFLKAVERVV